MGRDVTVFKLNACHSYHIEGRWSYQQAGRTNEVFR